MSELNDEPRQKVLLLQGGGALESYQAGVYEALSTHAHGLDWVRAISPRLLQFAG